MASKKTMEKVYTTTKSILHDWSTTPYMDARRAAMAECTQWLLEAPTGKVAGIRMTEHTELHDDSKAKIAVVTSEVWMEV